MQSTELNRNSRREGAESGEPARVALMLCLPVKIRKKDGVRKHITLHMPRRRIRFARCQLLAQKGLRVVAIDPEPMPTRIYGVITTERVIYERKLLFASVIDLHENYMSYLRIRLTAIGSVYNTPCLPELLLKVAQELFHVFSSFILP